VTAVLAAVAPAFAGAAPLSLAAAFAAGIAGSVHCVAMCGGISGALGLRAQRLGAGAGQARLQALCYQIGRIASYAAAGAICGAFGGALGALLDLQGIAVGMRFAAGLLLIALSLRVLLGWHLLDPLERAGGRLWSLIAPLARARAFSGTAGSLLLGMLWGWMPCGLIYSMLLFAALAGGAVPGAVTMALFGLGTLPAMLGGSLLTAHAWRWKAARGLRAGSAMLLFGFGIATLLAPLWHMHGGALGQSFLSWCRVPI
jgi:sulfite exporter TauE/SafE